MSVQMIKEDSNLVDIFRDRFVPNERVVVKLHFGEPSNETAFKPEDIKPYIDALKELGYEILMVDTPVAYDSPRNSKEGYEKAIKERGYDDVGEYVVSDEYVSVMIEDMEFEVAKELAEAKNVLVISHVKGHECAGFGGAIKNLGMGALSAKSKGMIHSVSQPNTHSELCIGCGVCAKLCPANAINIVDGKANVYLGMCYGCSICEINCPTKALTPKGRIFDDALAMGACAAISVMPKNTLYINVIKNITKACDCESDSGDIVAKDIGVLVSENPLSIDRESIDLINESEGKDVFMSVNNKGPKLQLEYATKYCDFRMEE